MKRYFLVSYIASSKIGNGIVNGSINIEASNGFLSRSKTTDIISDKNKEHLLFDIVITGFHEMSERDYQDWVSK